jgi:hypothetical protein
MLEKKGKELGAGGGELLHSRCSQQVVGSPGPQRDSGKDPRTEKCSSLAPPNGHSDPLRNQCQPDIIVGLVEEINGTAFGPWEFTRRLKVETKLPSR